jgi:hypothetical protein
MLESETSAFMFYLPQNLPVSSPQTFPPFAILAFQLAILVQRRTQATRSWRGIGDKDTGYLPPFLPRTWLNPTEYL